MATQPQTWTEDVAMDFSLSTGGDGFFLAAINMPSKCWKITVVITVVLTIDLFANF